MNRSRGGIPNECYLRGAASSPSLPDVNHEAIMPAAAREERLNGCRVLVAEDDFFLADDMATALRDLGAEVIGPVGSFRDGLMSMVTAPFIDVAVLDVNLRGDMVWPLAEILLDRGTDIVLATGYDRSGLPPRFLRLPRVEKPFDADRFARDLPHLRRRARHS